MKDFFKQYIPYYKNYKLYFLYTIIGMTMVAVGTAGTAYVIQPIMDEIFLKKDLEMLYLLPFLVVFLFALKGIGRFVQTYFISYIGSDIIRIVRDKFLDHVLKQNISFFNTKNGGELVSRVINDIGVIQNAVSSSIAVIIMESLTIIALVTVVIYQSPKLAFYGLVVLPLIIYPLSLLAKKMKKIAHKSQEKISIIMSVLNEIFNNIEIIIANNSQDIKSDKFKDHNKDFFKIGMKGIKTNALVSPLMEVVGSIAAATVIVMGGMEVIDGKLTTGAFFSFMTALFMLYTPIKKLSTVYNKFQEAIAANERINNIFEQESNILEGSKKLDFDINEVVFNNISLKYENKSALKNINFKVNKGDKIALVGDSGGGKSSLVNLIVRFYNPSSGEILFNKSNIKEFTFKSLRDSISLVTQRIYIFNDTISENVAFGQIFDERKVEMALKKAHAFDFVNELENGVDTILDEFGSNLSGGQRQRIAIARALYKEPKILIFDEATSALDNESESIISTVLDEVSKDKITFVIAHRLSTIKNSTKIAVFKDGEIICMDSEKNLLNTCTEYQRLYSLARV